MEYRIRFGDGRTRWIASHGRPHFAPNGEPVRLMGVSMDITDRKRAEEAFRASEARLEAGADLAGLGCYEVDFVKPSSFADDRLSEILRSSRWLPPKSQDPAVVDAAFAP